MSSKQHFLSFIDVVGNTAILCMRSKKKKQRNRSALVAAATILAILLIEKLKSEK